MCVCIGGTDFLKCQQCQMIMIAFFTIKVVWYPWLRVYALKSILDLRYRWVCSHLLLCFLWKEKYINRKQIGSQSRLLPVAQHTYIHMCFGHRTVYTYTITTVHLDFFRAFQVSRPNTLAHIRVPHMQCVCVYVHTYTQHLHINPLQKIGRHFPRPNESLILETNANWKPAGKTSLTPLLHTHAMMFRTPVYSAENICWAYICKKKLAITKWIKTMIQTTSTTTTARRKLMQK